MNWETFLMAASEFILGFAFGVSYMKCRKKKTEKERQHHIDARI